MLKLAPESDLETTVETENDDAINCATCGHLVTRLRWAITKNGHHEHEFMNPAGFAFLIQCFSEAPGVGAHGFPSDEFTWFKGYDWELWSKVVFGIRIKRRPDRRQLPRHHL